MGCGPENPASLGARFRIDGDRIRGTVTFDERQVGAPGFAHGGAVAAVMDDLLGSVLLVLNRPAVTASLTVDFRAPAFLGRELTLEAWCDRIEGRKLHLLGVVYDGEDVIAEGRAMFLQVDLSHWEASGEPLPESWGRWGVS